MRKLFSHEFNFNVENLEIPTAGWKIYLRPRLDEFRAKWDAPGNLIIIYYEGEIGKIRNSSSGV